MAAAFSVLPAMALIKYTSAAEVEWNVYLSDILTTFSAVLIIGFAFTTCWAFGREYTDKTISDLLVKPVSKLKIATAKFAAITLWNILLTVIIFAVVVIIGAFVGVTGGNIDIILRHFLMFLATAILTMCVSTISAFLANLTRGYLAPIGLIFLIVVIVNVAVNVGLSAYVPWTIPGLLLSEGSLKPISAAILLLTAIGGFAGTVAWWRYREQQ
jgi:ABC-2 type transport system permease protein